jgi:hypothetical protein
MPLVLADRVKETTTTVGTGTITLAGAASGFQSFSVIGNGNTTYYTIAGQGTSEWEIGIGTYTASGTTLSRDTVLASSAGAPNKTNFSAGTKDVFVTYTAARSVNVDGTSIDTFGLGAAQGDILYASGTNNFVLLNKNTTATRYLANTGTSNNPAWSQIDLTNGVTGALPVINGGTGQTTYTDGQLLIGNSTGNTLTKSTLTAGSGITITNGSGSITIASAGGSGTVTSVSAGAGMSFTTITSSGSVAMGTPSTITNTSTNTASGTSHNHELTGELVETTAGSPFYYGARAWVSFNGTGTVAIRASVNVSSITDHNTGDYTVNFTTAMTDTNYVVTGNCFATATGTTRGFISHSSNSAYSPATGSVRICSIAAGVGNTDYQYEYVAIFR